MDYLMVLVVEDCPGVRQRLNIAGGGGGGGHRPFCKIAAKYCGLNSSTTGCEIGFLPFSHSPLYISYPLMDPSHFFSLLPKK